MEYGKFKEAVLAELTDFYGRDAGAITVKGIKDDNGQCHEGIDISLQESGNGKTRCICLDALYDLYAAGTMDIYDCVEAIYREREIQKSHGEEVNDYGRNRKDSGYWHTDDYDSCD